MGVLKHPVVGLQESLVQALLSLHDLRVFTHPVAVLQESYIIKKLIAIDKIK